MGEFTFVVKTEGQKTFQVEADNELEASEKLVKAYEEGEEEKYLLESEGEGWVIPSGLNRKSLSERLLDHCYEGER